MSDRLHISIESACNSKGKVTLYTTKTKDSESRKIYRMKCYFIVIKPTIIARDLKDNVLLSVVNFGSKVFLTEQVNNQPPQI